jgi:hypothetical protein
VPKLAVGGIAPESMAGWIAARARGFGLGSALYDRALTPWTCAAAPTPSWSRGGEGAGCLLIHIHHFLMGKL